jgi:hypothetical protein
MPVEAPDRSNRKELDQEWGELVEELRLAIPGVEVLFGFLLVLPFQATFSTLSGAQRAVYFASLLSSALATVLLTAPSVNHRLRWRKGDKESLLHYGTRISIAATLFAAAAMTGSVYLITGVLFGGPVTGIPAALLAGCFGWFWYGRPLLLHHRARIPGPTSSDTPGGSIGCADPDPRARDPRPRAPEHPSDTARAR